jgi:hypothetical protein
MMPPLAVAEHPQRRSREELDMRRRVELWGRVRWPTARIVHELVVSRGDARADLAFVSKNHLALVEIKGPHDFGSRHLHQACHFRAAAPELWIVATARHDKALGFVGHLLPTVGLATVLTSEEPGIVPTRSARYADPYPPTMLGLLWVAELLEEAKLARLVQGKPRLSHAKLVERMMLLTPGEQLRAVCRQLRMRITLSQADDPC